MEDIEKIKLLPKYFKSSEVALFGDLAVYLNTNITRKPSDIDLFIINPVSNLAEKIQKYSKETNTKIDIFNNNSVGNCLNLSDKNLISQAIKEKNISSGKISYLCPEGLIVTKLTSLIYIWRRIPTKQVWDSST